MEVAGTRSVVRGRILTEHLSADMTQTLQELLDSVREEVIRREAELTRRERELTLLRKIDLRILDREDLDATLDFIVNETKTLLGVDHVHILMRKGDSLETVYSASKTDIGQIIPIETSVTGGCLNSLLPLMIADLTEEPFSSIYMPFRGSTVQMRSELAVPIITGSYGAIGVLNAESRAPNTFTAAHRTTCEALSSQIAIALENAQLSDKGRFFEDIDRIVFAEGHADDAVQQALTRVVHELHEVTSVEIAGAQILFLREDVLEVVYSTSEHDVGFFVQVEDSISGRAIRDGTTIMVGDVTQEPEYKRFLGSDIRSEIALPVLLGRVPIAVVNLESATANAFDRQYQRYILERFTQEVSVLLAFAKLKSDLLDALEAQHANDVLVAVGDQTGNLIHRLNNTIGAIRYLAQELELECADQLEQNTFLSETLRRIFELSEDALAMPEDLRRRIEASELTDVNATIVRVVEEIEPPLSVETRQNLALDLPRVDAFSFDLVVRNLVQNALDAMPDGGQLTITSRLVTREAASGGYIEVTFGDTGQGLSPDVRNKIFQINFTTKPDKQGKGLGYGLWWVRQFVLRVGGEIRVTAGDAGRGTIFVLRLPIRNGQLLDGR